MTRCRINHILCSAIIEVKRVFTAVAAQASTHNFKFTLQTIWVTTCLKDKIRKRRITTI